MITVVIPTRNPLLCLGSKIRLVGKWLQVNVQFLFSLLVGDKIPSEDTFYTLYILLRKILDIILTDAVYPEPCSLVKNLIDDFNTLYIKLGQRGLQPKFHHLIHYPRMMEKFDPVVHLWSMRYESKHRVGKHIARANAGRINICKTISTKIQL